MARTGLRLGIAACAALLAAAPSIAAAAPRAKPATKAEAAKVRKAFDAIETGTHRAILSGVTVKERGWACGNAEVYDEGWTSTPFAFEVATGKLTLPMYYSWHDGEAVALYNARCDGEISISFPERRLPPPPPSR